MSPGERRPMSEKERELSHALTRCIFLPGSWDKRFAHDVARQSLITEKQAASIAQLAWKYRRQLDPRIRPSAPPIPYGTGRRTA